MIGKNGLLVRAENSKDFPKLVKGNNFRHIFQVFFIFNNCLARIGLTGVIADVQTPRSTKLTYVIFLCHMHHMPNMMHMMHMTHMTWKYDVSQFGRSWCLKDHLDLSNSTSQSNSG